MTVGNFAAAALLLLAASACATQPEPDAKLAKLDRIVVIYAENHSFDNLYGMFPGANGIANARPEQTVQRDHDGAPLPHLLVWGADGKPSPDFPPLPNAPFRIDAPPIDRRLDQLVPSPIHAYYHNIEQIDGGRNDKFAAMSTVGGWVMATTTGAPCGSGSGRSSTPSPIISSWAPSAAPSSTING